MPVRNRAAKTMTTKTDPFSFHMHPSINLIKIGKPPALPGDSQSLTIPGIWFLGFNDR
jgi:hypothetical protein